MVQVVGTAHELRTMLKLYFSPASSSLATHIALIESGAAHELVPRLILSLIHI